MTRGRDTSPTVQMGNDEETVLGRRWARPEETASLSRMISLALDEVDATEVHAPAPPPEQAENRTHAGKPDRRRHHLGGATV